MIDDAKISDEAIDRLTKSVIDSVYRATGRAYAIDSVEMDMVRLVAATNFQVIREITRLEARAAVAADVLEVRGLLLGAKGLLLKTKEAQTALLAAQDKLANQIGDFDKKTADMGTQMGDAATHLKQADEVAGKCLTAMGAMGTKLIEAKSGRPEAGSTSEIGGRG